MRCELPVEVPPLHDSCKTFTDRHRLYINKLADFKVSWSNHITNRQEVFRCYFKLSKVSFDWQIMLQKVANLRLFHLSDLLFTTTDLNRVSPVFLLSFNLCDLTAIKLDDCARLQLSPFVPKMRAANFVTQSSNPHRVSSCCLSGLNLELSINLFFKTFKSLHLVCNAILASVGYSIIIQAVFLSQS